MKFVQFFFPNARRETVETVVPADIEVMADELSAAGWRFEIECFPSTQLVNADCCDEDGQLASCIVSNGPAVPPAIESMVRDAHARWVKLNRAKANTGALDLEEAAE